MDDFIQRTFAFDDKNIATVVGVTRDGQRSMYAFNTHEDAVFQIASITKVFTALLLCELVQRGTVTLSDPINAFLPKKVMPPARKDGSAITLEELASHRSGLPRLAPNMIPADPSDPYACYSEAKLYEYLSGLQVAPAGTYEYSNFGAGLLGHLLSRQVLLTTYDKAVRDYVCRPLGIPATSMKRKGLLQGHDSNGNAVVPWHWTTMAGGGALLSTVPDLLQMLEAHMGVVETSLLPAIDLAVSQQYPWPGGRIAMGWHISAQSGRDEVVNHNGGTYGFSSYCAFNRSRRVAVALLRNCGGDVPTTVGIELLRQLMS